MKKLICTLLALTMCLGITSVALAADVNEPEITTMGYPIAPYLEEYDQYINVSGEFVTGVFHTESTNGNSLRYWFKNDGKENCTVRLYKKGVFSDSMVSSMTVSPSDPGGKSAVYKNPGNGRYYMKVSAQYGGAIKGHLRANHTDL